MHAAQRPQSGISRRDALRIGALLTSGIALASCGSKGVGESGNSGEDIFRYAQGAPTVSLDPALAPVASTTRVTAQILEPLVAASHHTGEPEPALATSWDISPDRKVYTFTLRENIKFSDGTDFNAAAVLRNTRRWQALASATATTHLCVPFLPLYGWGFGGAEQLKDEQQAGQGTPASTAPTPSPSASPSPSADASGKAKESARPEAAKESHAEGTKESDTKTRSVPLLHSVEERDGKIVMTLSRPSMSFLRMLTQPAFGILSPECLDENSRLKDKPVGTGAFKVQSSEEAHTVLVRNEHYQRDNTKIRLKEIHFLTLTSSDKRYYYLVADRIDAFDQVSPGDLAPLAREGYLILPRDPFSLIYFDFNLEHPVLKNISVRRAIARAVDRGNINPYYLQGTADALGFLPALYRSRDEDESLKPYYRRDNNVAQSLLAAANYKSQPIECYYPVDVSLPWMNMPQTVYAQLISSLIEVGLNIKPVPLKWSDYCKRVFSTDKKRGMILGGFYGAYRDPYAFLGPVLAPLLASRWEAEREQHNRKVTDNPAPPDAAPTAPKSREPAPAPTSPSASASASSGASPSASASPTTSIDANTAPLPTESATADSTRSGEKTPSSTPSPTPTVTPAPIDPYPSLEQIMHEIREADSAETTDAQRAKYRQINTLLAQFMPGVPLLNVTSNVAMNRDVRDYVTEQNAVEYFMKVSVL